jgi:hypothetical protein
MQQPPLDARPPLSLSFEIRLRALKSQVRKYVVADPRGIVTPLVLDDPFFFSPRRLAHHSSPPIVSKQRKQTTRQHQPHHNADQPFHDAS